MIRISYFKMDLHFCKIRNFQFLILGILLLFILSCTSSLPPAEYVAYFDKHKKDFQITIKRNGVTATVSYMPNEYYAAREMQYDTALTAEKAMKQYENSLFFVFSISSEQFKDGSILFQRDGAEGFTDNIMKYTFDKDRDIFLLKGMDTVKVASCNYERNWGIGNADSYIMAFPRKKLEERMSGYHLYIKDMTPELGTVDVAINSLMKNVKKIKG
jgi:hypothetical protein